MKNKGFIATSLIYSFFLVFCTLLVGYVTLYMHNRNLLSNITVDIKNDIFKQSYVNLYDQVEVGSYVEIPIKKANYNVSSIKWLVLSKNSANKTVRLVSDSILFPTYAYNNLTNLQNEFNTFFGLYNKGLTYLVNTDMTIMNNITVLPIKRQMLYITPAYLYMNGSSAYKYDCTSMLSCTASGVSLTPPLVNMPTRGVITINGNFYLNGGDGSVINPYVLYNYITDHLKLHLDKRNNTGYGLSSTTILNDLSGTYEQSAVASISSGNYINLTNRDLTTNYNLQNIFNSSSGFTITLDFNTTLTNTTINFNGNSIRLTPSSILINGVTKTWSYVNPNITIIKSGSQLRIYNYNYNTSTLNNLGTISTSLGTSTAAFLLLQGISTNYLNTMLIYDKNLTENEIRNNYIFMNRGWYS